MLENAKLRGLIGLALKEDIGTIDVTTTNLISKSVKIKADILTREDGVICGIPVCEAVFEHLNAEIKFKPQVNEGDYVYKGKAVCYLEGPAWPILAGERTALNFLGRLSGISTETRKFAEKVRLYGTKILDTRKTTPGLRFLEKYAVKIGGGENHRKGLWDQVLIKDNHLKLLRSKPLTMNKMLKDVRRKIQKNTKIEIEVDNLKDFEEALGGYPDIIMLDNMEPGDIAKAVAIREKKGSKALIEVSGNIGLDNIEEYAKHRPDFISIGSLTHSVKSLDVSLEVYG